MAFITINNIVNTIEDSVTHEVSGPAGAARVLRHYFSTAEKFWLDDIMEEFSCGVRYISRQNGINGLVEITYED